MTQIIRIFELLGCSVTILADDQARFRLPTERIEEILSSCISRLYFNVERVRVSFSNRFDTTFTFICTLDGKLVSASHQIENFMLASENPGSDKVNRISNAINSSFLKILDQNSQAWIITKSLAERTGRESQIDSTPIFSYRAQIFQGEKSYSFPLENVSVGNFSGQDFVKAWVKIKGAIRIHNNYLYVNDLRILVGRLIFERLESGIKTGLVLPTYNAKSIWLGHRIPHETTSQFDNLFFQTKDLPLLEPKRLSADNFRTFSERINFSDNYDVAREIPDRASSRALQCFITAFYPSPRRTFMEMHSIPDNLPSLSDLKTDQTAFIFPRDDCKYNAFSIYLRCTVNPTARTCDNCTHYAPKKEI